jgi:RNA polymerase-binding protein DksA
MAALSPQLHEEIGKRLRQSREDLLAALRSRTDAPDDETPVIGPLTHTAQADDRSTAEVISHDEEHLAEHEARQLADIDAALARLETGGYGVCVSCGCEIPEARLVATPTVQTCVQCQERIEKEQRTGRGPTM